MSEKHAMAAMAKAAIGGEKPQVPVIQKTKADLRAACLAMEDCVSTVLEAALGKEPETGKTFPPDYTLKYLAGLRLVGQLLEDEEKLYIGEANQEYAALKPPKGVLVITEPTIFTATFKSYGGKAVYDYPADIVKMELALKQAKEAARADGTAKLVSAPRDTNVNSAFSISVTNLLH